MAQYAKINSGIVEQVIIAESSFFDTFVDSSPGLWLETSDKVNPASVGCSYDATRNAFISPRLFHSWSLNEITCQWDPPIEYPDDGKKYLWDEGTTNWVEISE